MTKQKLDLLKQLLKLQLTEKIDKLDIEQMYSVLAHIVTIKPKHIQFIKNVQRTLLNQSLKNKQKLYVDTSKTSTDNINPYEWKSTTGNTRIPFV